MVNEWFAASIQLVALFWAVVLVAVAAWTAMVIVGALRIGKLYVGTAFAGAVGAWGMLAVLLSESGVFLPMGLPPFLMLFMFAGLFALLFATKRTPLGAAVDALPIGAIILLQSFRLPLELVMHQAAVEGVMPPQMTYTGLNFDIATGALGLVVGLWALFGSAPRWALWGFNAIGTTLLLTIVGIAVLSMPTPLRQFMNDPPNVWITFSPFVLLPALLVVCAAWSHVVLTKRLLAGEGFKETATAA